MYDMKEYKNEEDFNFETVHKFLFQDEKGRELEVAFEAYKTVLADTPILGINMISIIRTDTNQGVSVPDTLYRSFHETALVKISENDKDISDYLPAY